MSHDEQTCWTCTDSPCSPPHPLIAESCAMGTRGCDAEHAPSTGAGRPTAQDQDEEARRVEGRLVVTDLCDMHAFHKEGRLGEVLRRAISFIEGRQCFPGYPGTELAWQRRESDRPRCVLCGGNKDLATRCGPCDQAVCSAGAKEAVRVLRDYADSAERFERQYPTGGLVRGRFAVADALRNAALAIEEERAPQTFTLPESDCASDAHEGRMGVMQTNMRTSEDRRIPVVTNDEAKGSGETHPEPLTPSSRPGASGEAGTFSDTKYCSSCDRFGGAHDARCPEGASDSSCPVWPPAGSVSESDLLHRVCNLLSEVWNHFEPEGHTANDCFCRSRVYEGGHWRSSGQAIAWVEALVRHGLVMAKDLPGKRSTER